jgi:hypothetical protein
VRRGDGLAVAWQSPAFLRETACCDVRWLGSRKRADSRTIPAGAALPLAGLPRAAQPCQTLPRRLPRNGRAIRADSRTTPATAKRCRATANRCHAGGGSLEPRRAASAKNEHGNGTIGRTRSTNHGGQERRDTVGHRLSRPKARADFGTIRHGTAAIATGMATPGDERQ